MSPVLRAPPLALALARSRLDRVWRSRGRESPSPPSLTHKNGILARTHFPLQGPWWLFLSFESANIRSGFPRVFPQWFHLRLCTLTRGYLYLSVVENRRVCFITTFSQQAWTKSDRINSDRLFEWEKQLFMGEAHNICCYSHWNQRSELIRSDFCPFAIHNSYRELYLWSSKPQ